MDKLKISMRNLSLEEAGEKLVNFLCIIMHILCHYEAFIFIKVHISAKCCENILNKLCIILSIFCGKYFMKFFHYVFHGMRPTTVIWLPYPHKLLRVILGKPKVSPILA